MKYPRRPEEFRLMCHSRQGTRRCKNAGALRHCNNLHQTALRAVNDQTLAHRPEHTGNGVRSAHLRIPAIATTHSNGSRPTVPIDRDQGGAGVTAPSLLFPVGAPGTPSGIDIEPEQLWLLKSQIVVIPSKPNSPVPPSIFIGWSTGSQK
jgi:hypothetical protein